MPVWLAKRLTPSSEFTQWLEYERLEVRGDERADWRIALFASQLLNFFSSKGGKAVAPKDLVLRFEREVSEQPKPDTELKSKLRQVFAAAFGRKKGR